MLESVGHWKMLVCVWCWAVGGGLAKTSRMAMSMENILGWQLASAFLSCVVLGSEPPCHWVLDFKVGTQKSTKALVG